MDYQAQVTVQGGHIIINGVIYDEFRYPSEACTVERYDGEKLIIVYDNGDGYYKNGHGSFWGLGLSNLFESDAEIKDFIRGNIIEAVHLAVLQLDSTTYLLNIAARDNHCRMSSDGIKWLNRHQIEIYEPIVKYFIENGFALSKAHTAD